MTSQPNTNDELPLLDALATGVICLDDALCVRYMNAAAEQILSLSAQRTIGLPLARVVTVPCSLSTRLRAALQEGQPCIDRQVPIDVQGHEPVLVDCSISPYRAGRQRAGLLVELTAVGRPQRIAREEAMLEQQEHAHSLLRSLAHEIRNPLGGLRGAAQLLQRQIDGDSELDEYTAIIIREADRLRALLDRMLAPASVPRHDRVNVHEVFEHVRKIALAGAPPGIGLRVDYDPSIPELASDRDRLVQVLLNIVGNAVQAIGDDGRILFRTRVRSNVTLHGRLHQLVADLEVHDDGPGVPSELIDRIFYPLVTGTAHGTGLGLSIAQSTMHQLGGVIEVHSVPGETVFTAVIPLESASDER